MTNIITRNKYIIKPLLEFLKNIQIESKKSTVEKEEKWEQKRDWKGEDQLGKL